MRLIRLVVVLLVCVAPTLVNGQAASAAGVETEHIAQQAGLGVTWCDSALKLPERPYRAEPSSTFRDEPILSLALSGGGYRAMLFHIGTLRRLNDSGLLPSLSVISSVSGGSVTAAYLAYRWRDLQFDESDRAVNFDEIIEEPLRDLAGSTLDIPSIVSGLLPFDSSAREQVKQFDKRLFKNALLSDIAPGKFADDPTARPRPVFIINATNLQTGELWQFRSSAMGGPITHWTSPGKTRLSEAVAASSGFPPFLSPMTLDLSEVPADDWHDCSDFRDSPYGINNRNEPGRVLASNAEIAPFHQRVMLTDGGVRDNLGLGSLQEITRLRRLHNTARRTITLLSDGGAATALDPNPASNWLQQSLRVLELMSDQPDEVRVAEVVRANSIRLRQYGWSATDRIGCSSDPIPARLDAARGQAATDDTFDAYVYWSIRRRPKYHVGFDCPSDPDRWMLEEVRRLSSVPTAFRAVPAPLQARLINWGYLATHHGLPYVDYAWPDRQIRERWLNTCALPYDVSVTDPDGGTTSARDARCLHLTRSSGQTEAYP
jgi:NTE family protein